MTAQETTHSLKTALALVADERVSTMLDASVPAMVLAGDGRRLRFLNAAAAQVVGIQDVRPMLGNPAPLDEAVLKHLQRVISGASKLGPSIERVRYYRGIKPIILTIHVEPLGVVAGEAAVLVTLPELARPNTDSSLQSTLDLYRGSDELITVFGDDDVVAIAGRHGVIDEVGSEIESIVERTQHAPVETAYVNAPGGQRPVLLVRLVTPTRRLLYIGPLERVQAAGLPGIEAPAVATVADEIADHIRVIAPAEAGLVDHRGDTATQSETTLSAGTIASVRSAPRAVATSFVFAPQPKPQRFVWELDSSGRFVVVGPELQARLGPAASPRIAESWDELANRLVLEAGISKLIDARQPWHGKTVAWPVEGTALRVPVDLTAMPVTDAERHFAGFRGFGVIHASAGVADPLATGLTLVSPAAEAGVAEVEPGLETAASVQPETVDPQWFEPIATEPEPSDETVAEVAPVALTPVEPAPSEAVELKFPRLVRMDQPDEPADQLVRLMPTAHISPETLRLTGAEHNAFRQIAEALGARFEGDEVTPPPEPDSSIRMLSTAQLLEQLNAPTSPTMLADWDPTVRDQVEDMRMSDTRLIDRLPIAAGLSRNERLLHVNAAFLKLTGYDSLEALRRAGGLDVLFAGPHAAKAWAEERRHLIPLVTKAGRVVPVDARIASVPWPGGTALLITLLSDDRPSLPAADHAGIALREGLGVAEDRIRELEAILAMASDGMVMLDGEGRIISANAPAEVLFGYAPGAMAGQHLIDIMAPDSQRAATDYLDGLARNGIGSLLLEGRELTGHARPDRSVALFATMARIAMQPEPKFAAVFRDISRWKTSEEELTLARRRAEEASLQKSDFLAKISHEIRTPLNAIIGFSEVMLGERFGAIGVDRYKDYLRDIQASGTHIMSLVNDLLDLSKVEAGKLEMKFEPVQLVDILTECVQLMQPQANRERIIIRASLSQGLPPVVADLRSIRQIVLNLLSNAIKYTPAGGQVIVSAALEDSNEVVIRIRDTGYGMSASDIAIALEPFRQVHNARGRNSGPGSGTGLGLPLTKALVEANRAALKIDSAVNQGTLVQVTFPAPRVLAAE